MVAIFSQLDEKRPQLLGIDLALRTEIPFGQLASLSSPMQVSSVDGDTAVREDRTSVTASPSQSADALADAMITAAEKDLHRYPNAGRAHANLGFALLRAGRVDEAVTAFESAIDHGSADPYVEWALFNALLESDHRGEARALLERIRPRGLDKPEVMFAYGALALRDGDTEGAVRWWRNVVTAQPENASAHFLLGLSLLGEGSTSRDRAIHHLKVATRLEPRDADFHQGLGIGLSVAGRTTAALRAFEAALHLQPSMTDAIEAVGKTLFELGRVGEAVDRTEAFLKRVPGDIRAYEMLAWLYFEGRKYSAARSQLFRALTTADSNSSPSGELVSRLTNNLGITYLVSGDTYHAEQMFRRAIQAEPTSLPPHTNLGRLLLKTNRPTQALTVLMAAKQAFPEEDEVRQGISAALIALRRANDAVAELEEWIEQDRSTTSSWATLGAILTDEIGDARRAVDVLSRGIARFGRDNSLINNLAYAFLMQGHPADARKVLEQIYDGTQPVAATPQLTATWGLLQLWEGDINAARRYYAAASVQAADEDHDLAQAIQQKENLEVARALLREGDMRAAREEIERGLALSSGRWDIRDKLVALGDSIQ